MELYTIRPGGEVTTLCCMQAWCAPCKRMKPVISDLSRKMEFNSITFAEVDVNQLQVRMHAYAFAG